MSVSLTAPSASNRPPLAYLANPYRPVRRRTLEVLAGDVGVGGDNPIRVQSMTTTRTQDIEATTAQAIRLAEAGSEMVRITAPTVADARAIGEVRARLRARGLSTPLIADIHFSPAAALAAVEFVEKVRINPGNFADSRRFAVREYADADYAEELERVAARFLPVVRACKDRGVALRIGTNHGSLSDRVMNRFGDTPEGMVESALEFVRICESVDFHQIILSMKASNPKVMIAAYRLLVARMHAAGQAYPLHLGVTEAGNGDDARIKSATGIGSLLLDGLGDTIRVSLAEEPEAEIPVAREIAALCAQPFADTQETRSPDGPPLPYDPYHYRRRAPEPVALGGVRLGGDEIVAVAGLVPNHQMRQAAVPLPLAGRGLAAQRPEVLIWDVGTTADLGRLAELAWKGAPPAPRALVARSFAADLLQQTLPWVQAVCLRLDGRQETGTVLDLASAAASRGVALWLAVEAQGTETMEAAPLVEAVRLAGRCGEVGQQQLLIGLQAATAALTVRGTRLLAALLADAGLSCPLVLQAPSTGDPMLAGAAAVGSLLCDGLGDAVLAASVPLAFDLLQGAGTRLTRTDFVACPSCGRTLFDLQSTTERIKARTGHLQGLKIAIMGCVVNGPGEMADADFGYMGGSPGHVNLYVGKECVERNIPEMEADSHLIALIKARGRWTEPATGPSGP
jgi:(E)-4-hydroxy-3-methylbut-2-enyl-diphosphate synthase